MSIQKSFGQRIGHFELQELLGEGGMGEVYRAIDLQLNRPVALKLMHPHIARQEVFRQRFIQEARTVAQLDHRHIITIHAFEAQGDYLYLVMEYVATGSLRGYLNRMYREGKFVTISEAVTLIRQVADALDYAHRKGMIHRDIKPDNVLLKLTTSTGLGETSFNALLTDFGLVKMAEGAILETQGNHPMGTPPYMSPEQIRGDELDGRTDLYSLGIMMYELMVGRLPFMPRNILEAAEMHIKTPPPPPKIIRPGIAPELETIILKTLAKDVNERYKTGRDLISDLQNLDLSENGVVTVLDSQARASNQLDSLQTYLASVPGMPQGVDVAIPQVSELVGDELVIAKEGSPAERYRLSISPVTIGREGQNITLQSSRVSRLHARIEKVSHNHYIITDLGSTNGTFLDGARLLANVSEKLLPGHIISIGEYRLSLQTKDKEDTAPINAISVGGVRGPTGTLADSYSNKPPNVAQRVIVQLNPPDLHVEPGMRTDAQIEVFNQSELVEHFRVAIQGIPTEWVIMPKNMLQLMPGTSGLLTITIHPPRLPSATAGTYNLGLRVSSEERGMEIARGTGTLSVNSFHSFTVDMSPKRVRRNGKVRVSINNTGNIPDSYTVSGRDREEGLIFIPPSSSGSVGPGRTEGIEIEARPRKTQLIGSPTIYPLEMRTVSSTNDFHVENGELVATPILPYWLLVIATLLCSLCLGIVMFFDPSLGDQDDDKTRVIEANNSQTAHVLTMTAEFGQTQIAYSRQTQIARNLTLTAQAHQTQTARALTLTAQAQIARNLTLTAQAHQTQTARALTLTAQSSVGFRETFELNLHAREAEDEDVDPSGQTVTWWHNHTGAREERLNELVAEFNADNPWGITVEASNQGSYADIYGKIIAGLTSGELPNLAVAYQNQALAYKAGGGIVDLSYFVNNPTFGLNEDERADFIPAIFDQDIADGVRIGFPPNRSAEVLYYNRSALAELGYDAPPANWDEFRELACAFTENGWSGYAGGDTIGYSVRTDASSVAGMTYALGADIFDPETNTYTYNNEATITALTFMQSLVADGCANLITENFADQNDFVAGKNLFYMGSTSGIPYIASQIQESGVELDWGITFIPYGETPAVNIYGASVSIIAGSSTLEEQLATWLFVRWFTEAEQQARWATASLYFPVRISTTIKLSDLFITYPQYNEAFALLLEGQGFVEPATAGYDAVRDEVQAAFQSILVEGVDVRSTLRALEITANEIEASFQ